MKKILLITPGLLPVPAVLGGAVETLIETIIKHNECDNDFKIVLTGKHHHKICGLKYKNTTIHLYKSSVLSKLADYFIYNYVEKIQKSWQSMFYINLFQTKGYKKYIKKILLKNNFDYIIVENNMSLLQTVWENTKDYEKKCIYHCHSVLINDPGALVYLSKCKKIIAVSEYVKNSLQINHPQLRNTNISVLKNGIDLSGYTDNNTSIREKYGIKEDDFVFLYSGRISPEKGLLELIEGFKPLYNCKLLVVGGCLPEIIKNSSANGTGLTIYYKRVFERASANDNIIFCGVVDYKDMHEYYKACDILVIPSVVEEAGPLTLIEGMAAGVPIIAADIGAIPEYANNYAQLIANDNNYVERLSAALSNAVEQGRQTINTKKKLFAQQYSAQNYYKGFVETIDTE